MELEQRITALENDVQDLKLEIRSVLADIRDSLPEKLTPAMRWQKKAWSLSLLNLVIAVALFSNLLFDAPSFLPFPWRVWVADWVQPFWIALAFVWLLLQMYPLVMLLQQEGKRWRGMAQRNLIGFVRSQPQLVLLLTALVLCIAVVNTVFPVAWFIAIVALFIGFASLLFKRLVDLWRHAARNA